MASTSLFQDFVMPDLLFRSLQSSANAGKLASLGIVSSPFHTCGWIVRRGVGTYGVRASKKLWNQRDRVYMEPYGVKTAASNRKFAGIFFTTEPGENPQTRHVDPY